MPKCDLSRAAHSKTPADPRNTVGATVIFVDSNHFDAALLDLDGVLTPTAAVHVRAWRQMFSAYCSPSW
jgi:hypothetical protein